jgi:predicted AlkP superfamily phosphohydrolase/phosphomutase
LKNHANLNFRWLIGREDYDEVVDKLAGELKGIKGDDGSILNTKIFKKKDYLKGKCENLAPDVIVYFDDLEYGCNTSRIGNVSLWSPQTALGSDDAAHSRQGIFVMNKSDKKGYVGEIEILDIPVTILGKLGVDIPLGLTGKVVDR